MLLPSRSGAFPISLPSQPSRAEPSFGPIEGVATFVVARWRYNCALSEDKRSLRAVVIVRQLLSFVLHRRRRVESGGSALSHRPAEWGRRSGGDDRSIINDQWTMMSLRVWKGRSRIDCRLTSFDSPQCSHTRLCNIVAINPITLWRSLLVSLLMSNIT